MNQTKESKKITGMVIICGDERTHTGLDENGERYVYTEYVKAKDIE